MREISAVAPYLNRRRFLQTSAAGATMLWLANNGFTDNVVAQSSEIGEPDQLDYPVNEYGVGAPLSLEQLHVVLAEINSAREHTPITDTMYVSYGANPQAYEQLGINFGYENTKEFLKYHLSVLEEIMYQGGVRSSSENRLAVRLRDLFVLQQGVAIPASHSPSFGLPNRELDTIRGSYISYGNPNIRDDYLGPDDTENEIVDANAKLVDLSLLHETGHFTGFGHPANRNVDLKVGTSMLPEFPDHWQRYAYERKFETEECEGTLMTGGGNTILDPEYAWMMSHFIQNNYTRYNSETYRGQEQMYTKNADRIQMDIDPKFSGLTAEVTRTFHLPDQDLSTVPSPVIQTLPEIQQTWSMFIPPDDSQAFYATQTINGNDYIFIGYQQNREQHVVSIFQTQIPVITQSEHTQQSEPLSEMKVEAQGDRSNGFILVSRQQIQDGSIPIGNPFEIQEGWIYPDSSTVLLKIKNGNETQAMRWLDNGDFLTIQPQNKNKRATQIRLGFNVVELPGEITAQDFDWNVEQEALEVVSKVYMPTVQKEQA